MKRILVCGSRKDDHAALVEAALDDEFRASPAGLRVIHGGIAGVAAAANAWAWGQRALGRGVDVVSCPMTTEEARAPRAFSHRNMRMLRTSRPQLVLAFPGDDESQHLVRIAPNATGANGLRTAARREAIASPLTHPETVGFGPEGAKKGATPSPAYPVLAVGKHREIVRVPSPPRTEWGLSEDLLAVGYAQCAGGVA